MLQAPSMLLLRLLVLFQRWVLARPSELSAKLASFLAMEALARL